MGILLPPIAQVTTVSNTHLTNHHRNRSLDSALQRIPEVDVTPSPECENVNTILSSDGHTTCTVPSSNTKTQRDELASLGSDDSGILCGSESGINDIRTCDEQLLIKNKNRSQESLDSGADSCDVIELITSTAKSERVISECENLSNCEDETDYGDEVSSDSSNNMQGCTSNDDEMEANKSSSTGLLRLLESKVFDVSMAIYYLSKSKESGVQSYIANRMFNFDDVRVDFYLPQLVCMYVQMHDVAEVIHPYLVHR